MAVGTLPSKDQWKEVSKSFTIGPPHTKRPRGRPKKKRIRGVDEQEGRKISKRVHQCSRCQGYGQHKNACKNPINQRRATQPIGGSNVELTGATHQSSRGRGVTMRRGRGVTIREGRGVTMRGGRGNRGGRHNSYN